jgi:hypothetical protein
MLVLMFAIIIDFYYLTTKIRYPKLQFLARREMSPVQIGITREWLM